MYRLFLYTYEIDKRKTRLTVVYSKGNTWNRRNLRLGKMPFTVYGGTGRMGTMKACATIKGAGAAIKTQKQAQFRPDGR
jgi:hypothetical protein